jgi:hypothetical protein
LIFAQDALRKIKIKSSPLLPLRGIFPRKRGKQKQRRAHGVSVAASSSHLRKTPPLSLLPLAGEGAPQGRMRAALDLRARRREQDRIKIKSSPLLPLRGIFPRERGKRSSTACEVLQRRHIGDEHLA